MTDDLSDELYEFHKTRAAFFEKTMLAARARLAELREKETTVLFGEKCDYQSDA